MKKQVKDQVLDQVREQVWVQVRNQVLWQVWSQVYRLSFLKGEVFDYRVEIYAEREK
jgi:hypothetical protein